MGFEYVSRSATETTLNILGRTATYETLYVNEFSSERQRMSVIVRCPDGTIKIFCKGADAMMLQRLSSDTDADLLSRVNDNLHYFSTKGLRTLVIGTREIDPDTFERWADRFEAAQGNLMGGTEIADKVPPLAALTRVTRAPCSKGHEHCCETVHNAERGGACSAWTRSRATSRWWA